MEEITKEGETIVITNTKEVPVEEYFAQQMEEVNKKQQDIVRMQAELTAKITSLMSLINN